MRILLDKMNERTGWSKEDLDQCANSIKMATPDDLHPGERVSSLDEANLVSSLCTDGETHMPVLDIDYNAALHPSSTPGHFHLFLDKELSWPAYLEVLEVLSKHGIIQEGFYEAAKERGMTMVRKPGVLKLRGTK